MRLKWTALALLALLLLPSLSHAMCWGLGGYGGSGSYDIETRQFLSSNTTNLEGRATTAGAELLFDSTCAGDDAFNFRLGLSAAHIALESHEVENPGELNLGVVEMLLGFRLYGSERFRLFVGPALGYGFANGEGQYLGNGDARYLAFGVAAGLNWHFAQRATLALTLGMRDANFSNDSSSFNFGPTIDGHVRTSYLALTLFFRPEEDQYVKLPPAPGESPQSQPSDK